MKLSKVWELGKENSQKTSEIVRQISFAGIALIWVLRNEDNSIDNGMLLSGLFLFVTMGFDLAQHVVTVIKFRGEAKKFKTELIEQGVPNSEHGMQSITISKDFHRKAGFFFWGKIIAVTFAYLIIFILLVKKFLIGE